MHRLFRLTAERIISVSRRKSGVDREGRRRVERMSRAVHVSERGGVRIGRVSDGAGRIIE